MMMLIGTPMIAKSSAISESPYKNNTTVIIGATSMNTNPVAIFCNCDGAGFSVDVDWIFLRDLTMKIDIMRTTAAASHRKNVRIAFDGVTVIEVFSGTVGAGTVGFIPADTDTVSPAETWTILS